MSPRALVSLAFVIVLGVAAYAFARPPDAGSRLEAVLNTGLSADPVRFNSTAVGTTIMDAIETDLATAYRTDQFTQILTVANLESAGNLCVGSVAWSGATSCSDRCGTAGAWTGQGYAATMNCTLGDASMGSVVRANTSRSFAYDGTRCICIVASTANVDVQIERTTR